jgi:hypothetical protein
MNTKKLLTHTSRRHFLQTTVLAASAFIPNRPLLWDAESLQITSVKEANACVRRTYREGWTL